MTDYDENKAITKEMLKSGIKAKLVTFAEDPNADHGTVCRIGDGWFYFGGTEAEMYSPRSIQRMFRRKELLTKSLMFLNLSGKKARRILISEKSTTTTGIF